MWGGQPLVPVTGLGSVVFCVVLWWFCVVLCFQAVGCLRIISFFVGGTVFTPFIIIIIIDIVSHSITSFHKPRSYTWPYYRA